MSVVFPINYYYEKKKNHFSCLRIEHFSSFKCFLLNKNMYHKETVLYHENYHYRNISFINIVTFIALFSNSNLTFTAQNTFLKDFTEKVPIFTCPSV